MNSRKINLAQLWYNKKRKTSAYAEVFKYLNGFNIFLLPKDNLSFHQNILRE